MEIAYYGGGFSWRRRGTLPPVLRHLLVANVVIFGLDVVGDYLDPRWDAFLFDSRRGVLPLQPNLNPEEARFFGLFHPWQLITYMFLHASLLHLGFNMLALWLFGAEIEERWGSRHFATYYFLCGIGGGIFQMVLPALLSREPVPVVGASGAIYGVLLAFGMMFPSRLVFVPIFFLPIGIPARLLVLIYAVISIFGGIGGRDGVAHFAHLGGMVFGYLYIKWQQYKRRFLRY